MTVSEGVSIGNIYQPHQPPRTELSLSMMILMVSNIEAM